MTSVRFRRGNLPLNPQTKNSCNDVDTLRTVELVERPSTHRREKPGPHGSARFARHPRTRSEFCKPEFAVTKLGLASTLTTSPKRFAERPRISSNYLARALLLFGYYAAHFIRAVAVAAGSRSPPRFT
jgi:hypothetical protein